MGKGKSEIFLQQQAATAGARKVKERKRESVARSNGVAVSKVELEEEEVGTELTIDSNELGEVLNFMDLDDPVDVIADSPEDEESRNVQEMLRYSRESVRGIMNLGVTPMEGDMIEVMEERGQRPKNRWLITTCRYCGEIYRFRSEEPQPPTCGKPQCIMKLEESSKKKAVAR